MSQEEKKLRKRLDTFIAVWQVNQAITSTLKTSRVLSLIMDAALKVMKADAVTIRLLSKDKKRLMLKAARGIVRQHFLKHSVSINDGLAGEALEKNVRQ